MQETIIDLRYFKKVLNPVYVPCLYDQKRYLILYGGAGAGKCLGKGTKVVMYSGELKKVEEIKVGDYLMGVDSAPRKVLSCHSGIDDLYIIKQNKGINYVVNSNHILSLRKCDIARKSGRYPDYENIVNIPLNEYIKKSKRWKRNFLGYKVGVEFSHKDVKIDPYFLGLWLGDGSKHTIEITTEDSVIKKYIYEYTKKLNLDITSRKNKKSRAESYFVVKKRILPKIDRVASSLKLYKDKEWLYQKYVVEKRSTNEIGKLVGKCPNTISMWLEKYNIARRKSNSEVYKERRVNKLVSWFREYNLFYNKHIPNDYLYNSKKIRLELLAGILDTDGYMSKNGYSIIQKNKKLAYQIYYLASSLGFRCNIRESFKPIKKINFKGIYYRISIDGDTQNIPVKIERKKVKRQNPRINPHTTGNLKIEYKGKGEYYGFTLDKDGLFLLEDFTVTHNSHFACQKILYRTMLEEGHRFLVVRKVARTLRESVFQLFLDYIYKWGLGELFTINRSEMKITFNGNNNMILFAGIDDPEKIKSIERITGIWIEEASELHIEDFEELDRRLRGVTKNYKQIILTYNPILKLNWTYLRFFADIKEEELKDMTRLKTNYKDNIYIQNDTAYIKLLESYSGNARTVYTLGEYGNLENAIYSNWKIIEDKEYPDEEAIYGLDFGYINPTCLLKIVVDMEQKKIYVDEVIYKRRLNLADLVIEMKKLGLEDKRIIADSEAPDKIEEIKANGFPYIEGAKKEKGSVLAGIDYIQQFKIYITKSSVNVKKEIETYQRRKDKDGNILEEPEKGLDHAMDSMRYVMYTAYYITSQPNFYVLE